MAGPEFSNKNPTTTHPATPLLAGRVLAQAGKGIYVYSLRHCSYVRVTVPTDGGVVKEATAQPYYGT